MVAAGRARAVLAARWPGLRAGLIATALLVGLIDGCPVPSERNLEQWPPAWVPVGRGMMATQALLLRPFRFIGDGLSVRQRWSLFGSASKTRHRLWIEARRGARPWHLLYRAHDPEHRYESDAIEYRRLRGAWNVHKRGPDLAYPAFCDWIALRIFRDEAERFDRVRVRMERVAVAAESSEFSPTGDFRYEMVRERVALLGEARP